MIHFQKNYFLAAILLFVVEVFIALFVRDMIIRPYIGDLLVVIFLYCLLRSFIKIPVQKAIFGVLLFTYIVEGAQYIDLVHLLNLQNNKVASIVLGTHFEWLDMLLYTLGALLVFLVEQKRGVLLKERC